MTTRAQSALAREKGWTIVEIAVNYAGVIALASFAVDRIGQPPVAACAGILAAALIAVNLALVRIAVGIARLDYDEPVVAIQARLEEIKMQRARLTATILLVGPLLWLPAFVTLLALGGIDAFHALGAAYLAANAALGVAFAIAGWFGARWFAARYPSARWLRGAIDALSGTSYRQAADFLDTIERFKATT
jgi:hypothetical protein